LKLRLYGDHSAAVEGDAFINDDSNVNGTGAAFVESLEQFQMGGKNPDTAADKLD
jgi:hypothetical protein